MVEYHWQEIILALIINSFLLYLLFVKFKSIELGPGDFPEERSKPAPKCIITVLLFVILACGLSIRLWRLGYEEFSIQELSYLMPFAKEASRHLGRDTAQTLHELFIHSSNMRFSHQPLTTILIFLISTIKCGIPYEFLFRVPSLVFGVATIWLLFLLGRELFNERVGLLASLLVAFSPYHIYYSRDLQPYCAVGFFTVCSYYLFVLVFFRNRYRLAPLYLMAVVTGFFFHLIGILVLMSQAGAFLLIWLKNKTSLYWKKSLLFYGMVISVFIYIFIFWSPVYFYYTLVVGPELLSARYFYFYPNIFNTATLPFKIFQTVIGFSPYNIGGTIIIGMLFLYSLISIKRESYNGFVILLVGILVVLIWNLCADGYFYIHIKRAYRGYRWGISILPFLYLALAYAINIKSSGRIFLRKAKVAMTGVGLSVLFIANLAMDYDILTTRQKPYFSQALTFINSFAAEGDASFFPIKFNAENFFYYLNRNPGDYSQHLAEALNQNYQYRPRYYYEYKDRMIPFLLEEVSGLYERIWIVDVRERIFDRIAFNHDYADSLLDYLRKNYNLILKKKFNYINIYLFNMSRSA